MKLLLMNRLLIKVIFGVIFTQFAFFDAKSFVFEVKKCRLKRFFFFKKEFTRKMLSETSILE